MPETKNKYSKLLLALTSFNTKERNRFFKFIQSPYFNVNENLTNLFRIYEGSIKRNEPEPAKEICWQGLFPEENINDLKLRKLQSDLLKLIMDFMAYEEFGENPLHKANYLLKSIGDKKLEKLYNTTMSTARRLSDRQLEKTSSYYYYQYQIEKNLFSLTSEFEKRAKSKSKLAELNIAQISENLDVFYLAEKLKYYCTLITWKNISNIDQDLEFAHNILEQVKNSNFLEYAPVAVYYNIYLSSIEPENTIHFEELKKKVRKYIHEFPLREARDIYDAALNYCIRKVNRGQRDYLNEAFELYKFGLSSKILISDGFISPISFRNICFFSLRLKLFDWTEYFILTYRDHLLPQYKNNAVSFNLARLHWHKKDFDKVIELLREVDFEDISYELTTKALLLSTYYETQEYDALHFLISSFGMFINRNKSKISEQRRKNYQNLIRFVSKLMKIRKGEAVKLQKLRDDIEAAGGIADKNWLLEKIEEKK